MTGSQLWQKYCLASGALPLASCFMLLLRYYNPQKEKLYNENITDKGQFPAFKNILQNLG